MSKVKGCEAGNRAGRECWPVNSPWRHYTLDPNGLQVATTTEGPAAQKAKAAILGSGKKVCDVRAQNTCSRCLPVHPAVNGQPSATGCSIGTSCEEAANCMLHSCR